MSRHHNHLNAHRWAIVRRAVLKRDNFRCVECGKAGRLEVDHISPLQREPGQDPYDVNGLQTLCRACHIEKTPPRKSPPVDACRAGMARAGRRDGRLKSGRRDVGALLETPWDIYAISFRVYMPPLLRYFR